MMVYQKLLQTNTPKLAVLIDPDKQSPENLINLVQLAQNAHVDFFFVGGSLLMEDSFEATVTFIKKHSTIPVIIFPGNNYQVSARADALLFLSLISGRNAEYLIGQHVLAAPIIKETKIETIPTG